jgi:hypothetical protein
MLCAAAVAHDRGVARAIEVDGKNTDARSRASWSQYSPGFATGETGRSGRLARVREGA